MDMGLITSSTWCQESFSEGTFCFISLRSRFRPGWVEWPEGGSYVTAPVLYIGPCCCPFPGVAHKSILPRILLSPRYRGPLHDWHRVTLSGDSAGGERVQRSNAGKWQGTRRQTPTRLCIRARASRDAYTNTVDGNTPSGAPTLTSWVMETHLSLYVCVDIPTLQGSTHQTPGRVYTGPQMFCTSYISCSWDMLFSVVTLYGTMHSFLLWVSFSIAGVFLLQAFYLCHYGPKRCYFIAMKRVRHLNQNNGKKKPFKKVNQGELNVHLDIYANRGFKGSLKWWHGDWGFENTACCFRNHAEREQRRVIFSKTTTA